MNSEEINAIAEAVSSRVVSGFSIKIDQLSTDVDSHERILKGNNGDMGLVEKVRKNTDSVRRIYAGLGFVGGAFVIEFIAWVVPKLELLIKSTP